MLYVDCDVSVFVDVGCSLFVVWRSLVVCCVQVVCCLLKCWWLLFGVCFVVSCLLFVVSCVWFAACRALRVLFVV